MRSICLLVVASLAICALAQPIPVHAQSFSCSLGRPACLDYGDKVCSQFGKCVSDDAVCFDSHTCNYKGFVCKSGFDEVVDKHDELVRDYNALLNRVNYLETCLLQSDDMSDVERCSELF